MSAAEEQLAEQLNFLGIPYEREVVFSPPRRFRFDFVCGPELAVEVDGGIWTGGRHSRGAGILKDCEKYALAAARGIRIVRVTPQHVKSGEAVQWILAALHWKPEAQR